ncbi:MAG: GGDEF domain-containing protein [Acidobacteria bacterium]|nr:GGDEF domain-containing protein [Acidobacteriota bacterium]
MTQFESLTEFQRRRIGAVLCEWDEKMPPAVIFSHLFPQAQLMTFSARFHRQASTGSRQKGFTEHFFLPLPDNFFEELERGIPRHCPENLLAQCAHVLELLETRRDYDSVCAYVAETLQARLPGVNWSVHIQEQERNWKTVFLSPAWKVETGKLISYLEEFIRGKERVLQGQIGMADDLVCVPLIKNGVVSGALCCQAAGYEASHYGRVLSEAAIFLGSAFHHVDMLIEKDRLTFTDTLTSLYNYRYLREFLMNEIRRCARYNKSVSILFIDIDWFKAVNDNHGHMAGSDTLVEIGRQFASIVRESDVVIRYGGDEFVIVLAETSPGGAQAIAERVRKSVESHVFGSDQRRNIRITVSIGIAGYPEHGFCVDDLIRKADGAMYEAKNLQKNTVRIAV